MWGVGEQKTRYNCVRISRRFAVVCERSELKKEIRIVLQDCVSTSWSLRRHK